MGPTAHTTFTGGAHFAAAALLPAGICRLHNYRTHVDRVSVENANEADSLARELSDLLQVSRQFVIPVTVCDQVL